MNELVELANRRKPPRRCCAGKAMVFKACQLGPDVIARSRQERSSPGLKKGRIVLEIALVSLQGIFRRPALGTHHLEEPVHMPVRR